MKFDPYEYIGVIIPGSILVVAVSLLYPDLAPLLEKSLSLGDLGLILVLSFVAGHLLQAGGNIYERVVWAPAGGMPTSWVAKTKTQLLSKDQLERLDRKISEDFGAGRAALSRGRGPMREIFVSIRQHGNIDRIEKFNRNYGLMRGIAVAFLVAAILTATIDFSQWRIVLLLLAACAVATYRMMRFGTHYAREVFAEYLNLKTKKADGNEATPAQSAAT